MFFFFFFLMCNHQICFFKNYYYTVNGRQLSFFFFFPLDKDFACNRKMLQWEGGGLWCVYFLSIHEEKIQSVKCFFPHRRKLREYVVWQVTTRLWFIHFFFSFMSCIYEKEGRGAVFIFVFGVGGWGWHQN